MCATCISDLYYQCYSLPRAIQRKCRTPECSLCVLGLFFLPPGRSSWSGGCRIHGMIGTPRRLRSSRGSRPGRRAGSSTSRDLWTKRPMLVFFSNKYHLHDGIIDVWFYVCIRLNHCSKYNSHFMLPPAALTTASMFSIVLNVSSLMPPSTRLPVTGSRPSCPDTKSRSCWMEENTKP
jgi:hypothetical protein